MVKKICLSIFTGILFTCCKHKAPVIPPPVQGTPVKVTAIQEKFMNDTLSLYGTTQFLKKTTVNSPIAGYVQSVNTSAGDIPDAGKVLFTLQTKEAAAYPANIADTLFKNSVIAVRANHRFQVDSVLKLSGDFVQEGEVLCQTVDPSSMVVRLSFPFEKNSLVKTGRKCELILPDGKVFPAIVSKILSRVDAASQTQDAFVQVAGIAVIPERLNVEVKFSQVASSPSLVLPKEAVLTNETMNEYWVMKLINDSTALRQNISIGKKTNEEVEIISPVFTADEKILVSGNYGLPDTAKVSVVK